MPQARRKRKQESDAATKPAKKRRPKAVEEEVLEDAEDEDLEDEESEEEEPGSSTRRRITHEIAQQAADIREEGGTWQDVIDATGFNGAQLRPHIARLTEAKIDTLEDTPESVAEHREEGYAWYAMAISLGKTVAEVEEMAEEGGAEVEGRKYRSNGGAEDAEAEGDEDMEEEDEDEEDDDEEEEEEPAPKRRAKSRAKSKPAAKPAKAKAGSGAKRRRKADPSEED